MRSNRRITLRGAAAAAALLLAAQPALAQDGWEWSGAVPQGGTLRLYVQNGDVSVRAASGGSARVVGRVEGGNDDAVRFEMVRDGDNVIVCALMDEDARCTAEGMRGGRQRWSGRSRTRGHLAVELPRGVDVRAASGNGDVTVDGAASDVHVTSGNGDVRVTDGGAAVRATTGNGDVRVSAAAGPVHATSGNGRVEIIAGHGPINASSGNGDVVVRMGRSTEDGNVRVSTGNGSVRLEVPAQFSGRLEASSGSGNIETEVPVSTQGRTSRYRLSGTIGDGTGPSLRISTGSGRVVVARAD